MIWVNFVCNFIFVYTFNIFKCLKPVFFVGAKVGVVRIIIRHNSKCTVAVNKSVWFWLLRTESFTKICHWRIIFKQSCCNKTADIYNAKQGAYYFARLWFYIFYAESNENCKDTENYNAVSCNVKRAYKNGYEQPDYLNPHNADICENYTQFSVALFIRTSADTAMPDMNTITDNGSTPLSQKLLEADFVWFKRGIIQNEYPATIIRSAIITRLNKFLSLMSRYIFAKAKIIATARSA